MKSIARSFVYWPNIDHDIQQYVQECEHCTRAAKISIRVPVTSWPILSGPWTRIHIDFAGPIHNMYFFFVVDAYSKWSEIIDMQTTTADCSFYSRRLIYSRTSRNYPVIMERSFRRYPKFTQTT